MTSRVSAQLRKRVTQRANNRCEYCLFPQKFYLFNFEMEHIISEKHGGKTVFENLALACPFCNLAKGTDLGSIDSETGVLTPFFNPRKHTWTEHFRLQDANIIPLTPEGRVTSKIFKLNHPDRIRERKLALEIGLLISP